MYEAKLQMKGIHGMQFKPPFDFKKDIDDSILNKNRSLNSFSENSF